MELEAIFARLELGIEIQVYSDCAKRYPKRSIYRSRYERKVRTARLALTILDAEKNRRKAA